MKTPVGCWGGTTRWRGALCAAALALLATAATAQQAGTAAADYRARTIYFIVTDRFHAHEPYAPYVDPQYPNATNSVNCFATSCTTEVQYRSYWGGDLGGIVQKIDYLQHLGIGSVWVTPLMRNVRDYGTGIGYGTGYHGYWVQNYDRVNPHFGSWYDVAAFSATLHAHGMRYMQDITLNHSNPNDTHVFGRLYRSEFADVPLVNSYADDFDPATGQHFYKHFQDDPRCQRLQFVADGDQSTWQLHHCLLADLSGYNQYNPTIADYLIGAGGLWLERGVDDFRLDAVKFPYPEFIGAFTSAMIGKSRDLGRSAPTFIGEWSHGGLGDEKSLAFANAYDKFHVNIFDFQLALRLNQFIGGDAEDPSQRITAQGLDQFVQARVDAFGGRDTWQGVFIDNHDQMRSLVRLQKLGIAEAERKQRMDLATVLLMTLRGVPVVFYGDEQYLANYDDGHDTPPSQINGDNDDPYNRVGMQSWDETTPAFRTIALLARLRADSPAVQSGDYVPLYADNDVLVFARRSGADTVLVAVNRGADATVTFPATGFAAGTYAGLLADTGPANLANSLTVTRGGTTLHVGALSAFVARSGH